MGRDKYRTPGGGGSVIHEKNFMWIYTQKAAPDFYARAETEDLKEFSFCICSQKRGYTQGNTVT